MDKTETITKAKYRNAFPAYRVFILGQEITNDVTSIRIRSSVGRQPNQCNIELLNNNDKYLITRSDMEIISLYLKQSKDQAKVSLNREKEFFKNFTEVTTSYLPSDDKYKISVKVDPKSSVEKSQVLKNVFDVTNESYKIKARVINAKLGITYSGSVVNIDGTEGNEQIFQKFPWKEGRSVFHPNDPVRVFIRDPFRPEVWWYGFSGFVSDQSENMNENLESIINITVEDVMRLLRLARIGVNPAILDPSANVITENSDSNLQDMSAQAFTNPFSNMTFHDVIETIFFGPNLKVFEEELLSIQAEDQTRLSDDEFRARWSVTKQQLDRQIQASENDKSVIPSVDALRKTLKSVTIKAVGKFSRKNTKFGPDVRVFGGTIYPSDMAIGGELLYSLKDWQNLVSHQVLTRDLTDLLDTDTFSKQSKEVKDFLGNLDPKNETLSPETIIDTIGKNPTLYPIEGKVRILVPSKLGVNIFRDVIDRVFQSNFIRAEYFDRLNVLYDAAERVDFVVQATPRGDVLVEMPLYDFDPDDFGSGELDYLGDLEVEKKRFQEDLMKRAPSELGKAVISSGGVETYQELYGKTLEGSIPQSVLYSATQRVYFKGQISDWEDMYTIRKSDTYNWNATESDDKIKTVMMAHRRYFKGMGGYSDMNVRKPIFVVLRNLVPVYGIRVEQGDAYGYIVDEEAARVFCLIKLQRANADAFTVGLGINPRFGALMNRPYKWQGRNHIFTCTSLSHTIAWPSSCETEINGNFSRGWEGEVDSNGKDIYTPIGGQASHPINYAFLAREIKTPKGQQ